MKYYIKIESTYNKRTNNYDILESNNKILHTSFMSKHNNETPYAKHVKIVSKKSVSYYEI